MSSRQSIKALLLAAWLLTVMAACGRNEFDLDIAAAPEVNRAYTVVWYASDPVKGSVMERVVSLKEGRGEMKCMTVHPTLVWLYDRSDAIGLTAYAERGDRLEITGSGADPLEWSVKGNDISEALSEWRTANAALLRAAGAGAEKEIMALNAAVAKYVTAHSDEPAAALVLLLYYDRRADSDGFRSLFKSLKGKAADSKWVMLTGDSDLLEGEPMTPSMPERVILKTFGTGCDTVEIGRAPALFYFSQARLEGYGEDIRKLRELSRATGDSASRVIANISTDPDSLSRASSWRRDSLDAALQAWAPLGLADPQVAPFGVRRLPWVIVIDRKGRVAYRGADMTRAAETMKKITR